MILKELCSDYIEVRKTAVKSARKYIADKKKHGVSIHNNVYLLIKMETATHNQWRMVVTFNVSKKAPWYATAICVTESDKGTKDYYLLRGLKSKPYFIKFTAHVVKRLYERNKFELEDLDFLPCIALKLHETVIAVNFVDYKYIKLINAIDEVVKNGELSKMFFTHLGTYFGFISSEGNCYLKTYISPEMTVSGLNISDNKINTDKEGMYSIVGITLHQYYNKFLYSKDELKLLYNCYPKGQEIEIDESPNIRTLKP